MRVFWRSDARGQIHCPAWRGELSDAGAPGESPQAKVIPFTAQTRLSGLDLPDGRAYRKGASDAVCAYIREQDAPIPAATPGLVDDVARQGSTPIVVAEGKNILGVVALSDVLKPGIRDRFERLRAMGLRVVMVTGDNPLTAAAIAEQAGVDDYIAEAKPEDKLEYIRKEQRAGRLIAMMGDGTNDAPALAQADIGDRHELRHPGGQGSREHGGSGQRPHQTDRGHRDRQATAHDPGRA